MAQDESFASTCTTLSADDARASKHDSDREDPFTLADIEARASQDSRDHGEPPSRDEGSVPASGPGDEVSAPESGREHSALAGGCCTSAHNRTLALLLAITFFLFMDQNLMAPNLTDIARDFNFTNHERDTKLGGEISFSLFVVGTPVSLLVGRYADRVNRKSLLSLVVFLGEVGCLATWMVRKYKTKPWTLNPNS
jgi:hypothetical protein